MLVMVRRDFHRTRHVVLGVVKNRPGLSSRLLLNYHRLEEDRFRVPRSFRFLVNRFRADVRVFGVHPRMGTRDAYVNVEDRVKFSVVGRSPTFAGEGVRFTIRSEATRSVVRRVRYNAFIVMYVVSATAGRCVYLVYIFDCYWVFEGVGEQEHATILGFRDEGVQRVFFYRASGFLRVVLSLGRGRRVPQLVRPANGKRSVFHTGAPRGFQFPRGISSRQVVARCRVFGVVRSRFKEVIFVKLSFIGGRFYFLFGLVLQGDEVRCGVPR